MQDIILITTDDIMSFTPISKELDPRLLEPFIPLAQVFHLRKTLGDTLYNELILAVSGDTLSGNSYTLLTQYITPMLAWYTYYEALPFIWAKTNSKGLTKDFSDNSQALDKKEYETLRQSILDMSVMMRNYMIDYLEANQTIFTSYRSEGSSTKGNSSGFFIGKRNYYNPENDEYCCE